ncbi:MAG: DUF4097 family beta strand repeat protein [Ruminiclostridium sp.]|nr:DUF4097 family beta strand repeat protein [Ruminiclostridium sp.]
MKRIRLLKVLAAVLAAAGAALIAAGLAIQLIAYRGGAGNGAVTETAELETPRELVVITTSMPVTVRYGDTENVTVSYTASLPLIFTEEKGMLRITQDDSFTMSLFSASSENTGITVTLPHKVYERISLSSSSGSVTSESLAADTLEFSTKSGALKLIGIDERASVRTESGTVYADVSSFSGDMTINAGSGDVTLIMPEELSMYLEFLTESGRFTSKRFDRLYHEKYGDAAAILGDGRSKLTVNTTSGSLYIY